MKEIWQMFGFPVWYSMFLVLLIVGALIYRFIKGMKIKAGPLEINTNEEEEKNEQPN